eukprot:8589972-Pyramimonas_sp.AAC.1
MKDSGAGAEASAAPREPTGCSPTKPESSDEENAPAAQVPPSDAALSGQQVAEPPSADHNPDAQGTPGSFEADTDLAQVDAF